jgi:hypothetical protein
MNFPRQQIALIALFAVAVTAFGFLACGDKATEDYGVFDVYGRVVYRPPLFMSSAEFYVYSNGQAVIDANIMIEDNIIPLIDTSSGYYTLPLEIEIGDTLEYSISSEFGSLYGNLIIPDTAQIIRPLEEDTLLFGADFSASWQRASGADGYYSYLEYQGGFVAAVTETYFDTTATLPGAGFLESGFDRFWLEALNGSVVRGVTPDGRIFPRGVVGCAAGYREVYIDLAR